MPVDNILTERHIDVTDKILALFELPGANMEWSTYGLWNTAFSSGKVGYVHGTLGALANYRAMEDDFGFVPYPKLDEAQEDYRVRIMTDAALTYIPVTNDRLDVTGATLEIMACESQNTVIPTYFDTVLTIKTMRDTESEKMLPIIQQACSFEDCAVTAFYYNNVIRQKQALATYYAGIQAKVTEEIQTIINTYK